MKEIPKSQILERIRFENPWWNTQEIEADFKAMSRRLYFKQFKQLVYEESVRRAVVLMGPRRVGKTVMLHHLIMDMIEKGIPPKKIILITVENPIYINLPLEELFLYAKEASGVQEKTGWYLILDEIQYCKDWGIYLKLMVDHYREDRFIVSGSAAAALKYTSTESGAGRFSDFLLPPLTFCEYVDFKGLNDLVRPIQLKWQDSEVEFFTSTHITELNRHFIDYLNFGGYPEVIFSDKLRQNTNRYIAQDIVDKVLLKDLPSIYGISDTRELNSLFTTIAFNTGNEFSLETLRSQSQVQKNTLKKYLTYLEAAFLIKKVARVDESAKHFKRNNFFKIYLVNPSLRSALFAPVTATDEYIGNMVETAIYAQWMHRKTFTPYYARWKNEGEVDMVKLSKKDLKLSWALEIKWSNRYVAQPNELKSLLKFCKKNNLENPIVTTIDIEKKVEFDGLELQFFPAATYAYTIGYRTFHSEKKVKDKPETTRGRSEVTADDLAELYWQPFNEICRNIFPKDKNQGIAHTKKPKRIENVLKILNNRLKELGGAIHYFDSRGRQFDFSEKEKVDFVKKGNRWQMISKLNNIEEYWVKEFNITDIYCKYCDYSWSNAAFDFILFCCKSDEPYVFDNQEVYQMNIFDSKHPISFEEVNSGYALIDDESISLNNKRLDVFYRESKNVYFFLTTKHHFLNGSDQEKTNNRFFKKLNEEGFKLTPEILLEYIKEIKKVTKDRLKYSLNLKDIELLNDYGKAYLGFKKI